MKIWLNFFWEIKKINDYNEVPTVGLDTISAFASNKVFCDHFKLVIPTKGTSMALIATPITSPVQFQGKALPDDTPSIHISQSIDHSELIVLVYDRPLIKTIHATAFRRIFYMIPVINVDRYLHNCGISLNWYINFFIFYLLLIVII